MNRYAETVPRFPVLIALTSMACTPVMPDPESGRTGKTEVTVTRINPDEPNEAPRPVVATPEEPRARPAKPIEPAAQPSVSGPVPLVGGASAEGPLPLPTTLATTKSFLFAFARTRAGWVVRAQSTKAKAPTWSPPSVVAAAFDDDATPFAIADGEASWFGVSSPSAGTRVARVDAPTSAGPRVTAIGKVPSKLGRLASFVPMKPHVAVVGRDGDTITFARLDRLGGFLDASAKAIGHGQASMGTYASRSPRATLEDDRLLVAWDADDVPGALEAPGTTAAERAAPRSGIYVRRFSAAGEPASPARRLTRPSFEAHALDIVVELGACAVLASTAEGFEMFRFVRKGDALDPYGGGLHLAAPGGDVALGADVIGTIGITTTKLLRIGPGIKIVSSPLGFSPPPGGAFDEVRVAMDGYGAHAVFATKTALGSMPTIARVDGEKMGGLVGTPWIGPAPQRLAFADVDGDEALALVVSGGAVYAVRLGLDGGTKAASDVAIEPKALSTLDWPRSPYPRAVRAGGEWVIALRDGRAMFATGAKAGTFLPLAPPKGAPGGGTLTWLPSNGKAGAARALYVPPPEAQAALWTTTVDPKLGVASSWMPLPGTERNYGVLGAARFAGVPRTDGGLWLLTNSGPKVSTVAQLYGLMSVDADGKPAEIDVDAPAPVQEISLAVGVGGPVLLASLTGTGVAARGLDAMTSWAESFAFTPFRVRGEGPVVREKGVPLLLTPGALPVELGIDVSSYLGERCPFQLPAGPRALLLACEEGTGDTPLAARATARVLKF